MPALSRPQDKPWLVWLVALLLAAGTFVLYAPSLQSGFVYDAEEQIQNDDYIHIPSHFLDVVTLRVLGEDVLDNDRPVHLFFLMLDSLIGGRDPYGYHLTSILFHAANVALVFLLLATLTKARGLGLIAPALAALFFAVHPANVEAVAEVSDREDPLAAFFLLLGLWSATRIGKNWNRSSRLWASAGVISFFLAAGAKETGYVGPILLGFYWLLFRRPENKRCWIGFILAVTVVVFGFVALYAAAMPRHSHIFTTHPQYMGGSLFAVFTIQPSLWAFLLKNVVWPLRLSADYVPSDLRGFTLPVSLLVLTVLVLIQFLLSRKSRLALFGSVAFWLGLAPVSNFIPLYHPLADRFLYLPLFGAAVMVCAALYLVPPKFQWAAWSFSGLILIPLVVLTWQRQDAFANSVNLWRDTMAKSPGSEIAANNLGWALMDRGGDHEALTFYNRALQLTQAKDADAWAGAAISFEKLGRFSDAETALGHAVTLDRIYGDPDEMILEMRISRKNAENLRVILQRMQSPGKTR